MQFDDSAQIDMLSTMPARPVKPEQSYSWNTPWRAVKAATADVLGSTADVLKGFAAGSAITAQADPVALAVLGEQKIREGAEEARRQIASDEALTSDIGTSFRNVSASMRPDPATASTAEQVVFGAVRLGGKLVAGSALGPFGIAGAAAEEGLTQAEDLRRQGVGFETRTTVGAVTAGATGVSAALPMAGSTVPRTVGMYLAGGPGGFVAQQAATRAILEGADYGELAKQYDPLDPVGLAVSALVPLPFAVVGGMRAARSAPAPQADVDAAMVHNLSLAQDAAEQRFATALDESQPAYLRAGALGDPLDGDAMLTQRFVDEVNERQTGVRRAPPARPAPELPGQSEAKPAAVDELAAVRERMATLEKEFPGFAAEMEAVRLAIREGDDVELGTLDADLLKVAAECALSIGST